MAAKCPVCGHEGTAIAQEQVSMTGWIVFIVLLVVCIPLCWIPFVVSGLKEQVYKCSQCGAKIATG